MAESLTRFATPIRESDLQNSLAKVDGCGWLGPSIAGKRVLCLAAGGGRQSAYYAAAGAEVTVVDISPEMLRLDREIAAEFRFEVRTVETSMDDLSMFPRASFDIVVQPVSSCYLPNIGAIYQQVAAVMIAGGIYVSQHKQPTSLQVVDGPHPHGYTLAEPYYRSGPLPPAESPNRLREPGTMEFLHRWEEIIGAMCRAGFVVEDLLEPRHGQADGAVGSFSHRSHFIPPYVRIKARRIGLQAPDLIQVR